MQSGYPLTDAGQAPGPAAIAAAIVGALARGVITSSLPPQEHCHGIVGDNQGKPAGSAETTVAAATDRVTRRIDARVAGVLSPERSVRPGPASPSTETR
jgi:hypothetical protein